MEWYGGIAFPGEGIRMVLIGSDAFVKQVTGFAPEILMKHRRELEKIYKGQSMSPFPFPVTWIEK